MSKYRQIKKKNDYARCLWLADNLGCIRRSFLVDYFRKHGRDFSLVKKLCRKQKYNPFYVRSVVEDMRNNYRDPDYLKKSSDFKTRQIEDTYFTPYFGLKKNRMNIGVGLEQFFRFSEDYNFFKMPNGDFKVLRRNR